MHFFLALFFLLQGLPALIDGVERTFARMNDFSADFHQISKDVLNRTQQAEGHLFLKRQHGPVGIYESGRAAFRIGWQDRILLRPFG